MKLFSKEFLIYAGERSVKTFFQSLLAMFGGQQLQVFDVDWVGVLGVSLGAGLLSIATSVVANSKLTSNVESVD